ncbi:MAG: zf-HC2 domain-containing protein [Gemmatimonadales bacterium]|nr:zf-HC2 domain-containing protein [Gemmatimonadales bacterium]
MSDPWMERLSDYLEDDMPAAERLALEAHLETCRDCSVVVSDLRRVMNRARQMDERQPHRDLWPGIAKRIGATSAGAQPIRRRWSFSSPQLAAAAVLLMTFSGSTVWLMRSAGSLPADGPIAATAPPPATVTAVNVRRNAAENYAAAVEDLERVLSAGRGQLDTTTVRVIEQNLAVIDQAIAQAQRALLADPANLYLNTHLAETMRRKLDLLRQAATLVPVS